MFTQNNKYVLHILLVFFWNILCDIFIFDRKNFVRLIKYYKELIFVIALNYDSFIK